MRDLFGATLTPYYITHPDLDYTIRIYAASDAEAFASMDANDIPGYDKGWRFYMNGQNHNLEGKRIISVGEWKTIQEEEQDLEKLNELRERREDLDRQKGRI